MKYANDECKSFANARHIRACKVNGDLGHLSHISGPPTHSYMRNDDDVFVCGSLSFGVGAKDWQKCTGFTYHCCSCCCCFCRSVCVRDAWSVGV